ncbi:MAG: ATP-binding protein [Alphaproteobacteria bacterium]|nr:ATP-binding protein [Alphaproteobacteria bacterium]MDY4690429.1 AAA family ATPase [Alphaproteobacteria bacterium]
MKEAKVRIKNIKLKNFKNVGYGKIEFSPKNDEQISPADIIGIYGQNGSGKTAVIDALHYIQILLSGQSLNKDFINYISYNQQTAKIEIAFLVEYPDIKYDVVYQISFEKNKDDEYYIQNETITSSTIKAGRKSTKRLIEYTNGNEVFQPKTRYEEFVSIYKDAAIDLIVAKKIAEKNKCSYIFGSDNQKIYQKIIVNYKDILTDNELNDTLKIIYALSYYSSINLFVLKNSHSAVIGADFLLPVAFKMKDDEKVTKGDLVITFREPNLLDNEKFDILKHVIDQENIVIKQIIPGLELNIKDYGKQILENGKEGNKVDLLSTRNGISIPIRYESEGIIKIISILNALISAYNSSGVCLAIDELDAGIYEYLLGELLGIFSDGAKGQLIFTSHNLRPLEVLKSNNVIFSTINPLNRYIKLSKIKKNNNLRDVYLRAVSLDGQEEVLYEKTDNIKITRAFRNAAKVVLNEY